MKTWCFEKNNDYLVKLVLSGKKTAVTELDDGKESEIGEESILVFDNEKEACVTKLVKVIVTEFKNITADLTELEGEGDTSEWYNDHLEYFKSINKDFNSETKVKFKIFEVTENLAEKRKEWALKVIEANKDIFNGENEVEEINAGFNNTVFKVDDKYIIKVCGRDDDNQFKVEADFYHENDSNVEVPKLYKYDDSKTVIPYVYEIMEKVEGESLYYYWYKMTEAERENIIKRIVEVMKSIHKKDYEGYDWALKVKGEVQEGFNECKDMFNDEEQDVIKYSIKLYAPILSENKFSFIHNDLHFDNILIDSDKEIKLIDFNDAMVAPFDYDFRILYMCMERPWKWANSEMDPYQKPEDYKYIFDYVKEYYEELNKVNYLEHRMIIYTILNDMRLLKRFKNKELISNIVQKSQLLIDKFVEKEND